MALGGAVEKHNAETRKVVRWAEARDTHLDV